MDVLAKLMDYMPSKFNIQKANMGHSVSNQPIFRKCNMSQMFPKKLLNIPQCVLMTHIFLQILIIISF